MKKVISILLILFFSVTSLFSQSDPFEVEITGEGQPILLLPGFTCTGDVWKETVAVLSETYECHVFTLAGFGNVAPVETPWLPKIKDGLIEYVKKNKLTSPIIIGHSLGGTLGLWMSSLEPTLFEKLIIVDAIPSAGALMIPDFSPEKMAYDTPYNNRLLSMNDSDFKEMASQMAAFMSLNKDKHTQITDWMLEADRNTYVYGYTDLLKLDLRETIENIKIPVVLLAATYPNKEIVKANYDKQYARLKNLTVFYADDSAHFIMYDQPEWFMNHIKKQLK